MLTKTDLKAIGKLLDKGFSQQEKRIDERFNKIDKRFGLVDKRFDKIEKDIRKIHRDIKLVINAFDREYLQLRARIERLEEHLKLPRLFAYQ